MVETMFQANPIYILPATAVYFFGVWLRAARWRLLMAPFASIPTERLFRVILIGFAVNNVLPLRLGELVRTFLLRQSHGVPIASTLATVLIERLLDVFVLCGILTAVLIWAQPRGWLLAAAGTEIGRASCRERVEITVVGGALKK